MHRNSLTAYAEEEARLGSRAAQILALLRTDGPLTDRQVCARMGYADMNSVRPRITELIDNKLIEEVDDIRCPVTGKKVRQVAVKENQKQGKLF